MSFRTDDFQYDLPAELIAQRPPEARSASRLMVLDRRTGRAGDHVFDELDALLQPGDLLVLNDTRVIPARFFCRRETGGRIEGLFLDEPEPGKWLAMLRNAGRCRTGEPLRVAGADDVLLRPVEKLGEGRYVLEATPPDVPAVEVLARAGSAPLPPYIRRDGASDDEDLLRYQTVYARRPGAVAAPTAGLHFTEELMDRLEAAGVERAYVTLHVGPGTFAPVKADRIEAHRMHAERYELSGATAGRLNAAHREGRRIVAVGTTSVRVLETACRDADAPFAPAGGWTDIFIRPPHEFRAVDALITNFHLPRSTLLMLVAAFCDPGGTGGVAMILDAYRQAVQRRYRFYSYGDAMLIQ